GLLLETQLQGELHEPRAAGAQAHVVLRRIRGREQRSKIGRRAYVAGNRKAGVIENVEEFSAELNIHFLPDFCVFQQREIKVAIPGSDNEVAAWFSNCPSGF